MAKQELQEVRVTLGLFEEIEESYSGDTIAGEGHTIRKPFKYQGKFYVSSGGRYGGTPQNEAYEIVPEDYFKGEAHWYGDDARPGEDWTEVRKNQPEGFYHGMLVKRGSMVFVMVGPPLLFMPKEDAARMKQLTLF